MSIDWIPVREIRPKEQGNRGFIPTCKTRNGVAEYESCLERDFYLLCDHDRSVTRYQPQPVTLHYTDSDGKDRQYTPDVFVEYVDHGPGLYEIKYAEEVSKNHEKYEERWNAAREWATRNGAEFKVLTETAIRSARKENVWFTLGSSKCATNDSYTTKLTALLKSEGVTYKESCYLLSEELRVEISKAAQIVCYAIYHGLVFVDTFSTRQLANDTIIRPCKLRDNTPFRPLWEDLMQAEEKGEGEFTQDIVFQEQPKGLSSSTSPRQEEIERRLSIVKSFLKQPSVNRTISWRKAFCTQHGLSESTVYRWVVAYEESGIDALVPKHDKKGRRKKYTPDVLDLVEKARKYFLNPMVTLKRAYKELQEYCLEKNVNSPPYSYLEWYIYQHTTRSEFCQKEGKRYHKSRFTPSLASFQGASMPMQVMQIDSTSYDVFPVDENERETLCTPSMIAAIDCYTRMITGFSVSFFPSSSQSVLEVLVQSILPKTEYTEKYETEFDWPVNGFPVVLLADNGMDYQSNNVREFCLKNDIILEHAPIRTPRYKAFVEQWFNVLHKALVQEDVEGIRPTLQARLKNPDLRPEAEAIFTIQEIETWLHKWIVDEYHYSNQYDDHVLAPRLRFKKAEEGNDTIIFPAPREPPQNSKEIDLLRLATVDRFPRVLGPHGITWEHLSYNNARIGELYKRVGKVELSILMDRRDVRHVWIVDPESQEPIMTGLATGWAQEIANEHGVKPIHKSAWINEMKRLKNETRTKITPYLYGKMQSRKKRDEIKTRAGKTKKSIRKEVERIKETERKDVSKKLQAVQETSQKNDAEEPEERPRKDIDWSKVTRLPTDDFYSGR